MNAIVPAQPAATVTAVAAGGMAAGGRGAALLNLEVGQILRATVVDLPVRGQVTLALGDSRLRAESNLLLQPGQNLSLRLVASEPRLVFSLADSAASIPQFLGKNVAASGKAMAVTTLFSVLQQAEPPILPRLSPESQQTLLNYLRWQEAQPTSQDKGGILKQLLEHLGLNLERNLAAGRPEAAKTSLKAALTEIVQQSVQTEANKGAAQAKGMLSAIEMFQLAQAQLATGKEQIYPLPLPFLETGYLLVEEDGGQRQSGDEEAMPAKFSLFLSLTDLGFLRIDFVKSPEGLALRLRADNQEKADFIASFADDLRGSISDTAVIALSFAADAQDPIKELLHKTLPGDSGLLNATA